MTSLNTRKSRS